jgi:hypothetical protein
MKWDIENQKLVAKYLNRLAGVYEVAIKKAVELGYSVTNYNSDKPFSFADYPVTNKKADTLFSQMAYELQSIVNGGTESAWIAANTVNDGLVDKYFAKSGLSKEQLSKYYDRNLNALAAYQKRVDGGVTLSDRVWKYTNQFKNEIELAVSVGIGEGRSASEVSRDVRQYLQQPDKLFHRVRNKYGELVLSKAAKAYHPGQGVYRSSYKNALRLTRTEINMSFHNADYERWNTLNFVAGYRVVLSKAHPEYDICDELQGEYPKTFAFWGWHVQCMCHTEPILSPQKEFVNNLVKQLKGEDTTGYIPSNQITKMPPNFKQWASDNQERIAKAKSMPYFIDKNFKGTNVADWFKVAEKTAAIAEKTPLLSAKELEKLEWKKDEIIYAKKKLAEAEKWGVTGGAYDALLAAIENESLTYAQIAGKSSKLVQDIKAAKAAADPFSEAALLKKFSKKEVESMFESVNAKISQITKSSTLEQQVKDLLFEANWIADKKKYSTWYEASELFKQKANEINKILLINQEVDKFSFLANVVEYAGGKALKEEYEKLFYAIKSGKLKSTDEKIKVFTDKVYAKTAAKDKISIVADIEDYCDKNRHKAKFIDNYDDFNDMQKEMTYHHGSKWRTFSESHKDALYRYTGSGYDEINRNLYRYGTVDEYAAKITESLDQIKLPRDMMFRRGTDYREVRSIFGDEFASAIESGNIEKVNKLIGSRGVNESFISTSFTELGGFGGSVEFVFFAPKGTSTMYAKSFSAHDRGFGRKWNGIDLMQNFSGTLENEFIVNRGYEYRVYKIEFGTGRGSVRIYVDLLTQKKRKVK